MSEHPARHLVITLRTSFVPTEVVTPGSMVGRSADFGGVSHLLDAALWLTGARPTWVQASLSGRPVHTAALQVGLSTGAVLVLTHAASAEPGVHGGWSVLGEGWEVGFSGGYVPAREGWCISPVRCFGSGAWRDLAPGLEPVPGAREPWAEAHVETARRFLAMFGAPRAEERELATVEEAATVQRILSAAMAAEEGGRRILTLRGGEDPRELLQYRKGRSPRGKPSGMGRT